MKRSHVCVLVGPKALCSPPIHEGAFCALEAIPRPTCYRLKYLLTLTPSLKLFRLALSSQPKGSRDFPRPLASTPRVKRAFSLPSGQWNAVPSTRNNNLNNNHTAPLNTPRHEYAHDRKCSRECFVHGWITSGRGHRTDE